MVMAIIAIITLDRINNNGNYIRWLEAQIDYYNGELWQYNNSIARMNRI